MIAVDSSALVAVAKNEAHSLFVGELLSSRRCLLSMPTWHEVHSVLRNVAAQNPGFPVDANAFIERFLDLPNFELVALNRDHLNESRLAFDRYGKGQGHPAQLNFGDCISYAVAKVARIPLLFVGDDFSQTDITPAYIPA